jgi:hypothetical protein
MPHVERVRVKKSLDKGLDENAVTAVRKWKRGKRKFKAFPQVARGGTKA